MAKKSKNITYKEIADLAKVGIGSVSRYFNNGDVSAKMSEKIKRIVEELNYVPNWFAQSLQKRTKDIFIIAAINEGEKANDFWIYKINFALKRHFNAFVVFSEYNPKSYLDDLKNVIARKPDGVILMMPEKSLILEQYINSLVNFNVYVVNRNLSYLNISSYFFDDELIYYDLTKTVINSLGTDAKIGYIGKNEQDPTTGLERYTGFLRATKELGVACQFSLIENSVVQAYDSAQELLENGCAAIVCGTHTIFKGALLKKEALASCVVLTDVINDSGSFSQHAGFTACLDTSELVENIVSNLVNDVKQCYKAVSYTIEKAKNGN